MKRNLILLVLCAIIGIYFFLDTKRIEEEEKQEENEKQLVTLSQDEVKEVNLVNGKGFFKAVKEEGNWKLVQPFDTNADNTAWNNIVRNIAGGKRERVINENPEELSVFGLQEPKIQITASGVDGATATTLLIGDETPTSGKYYAMIQDSSAVVTVSNTIYTNANKELFDLRDKTILAFETDQVQRVEINHPTLNVELAKKGTDEWLINKPIQARAEASKISGMLNKVKNSTIKQFVDETPDDLATYGLIDPVTKIVIWTGDQSDESSLASRALLLGATNVNEHVYAKREGQENVFAVDPKDFNNVPQSIDELRMKKIIALKSWNVDQLKILSATGTILNASKDSGEWYLSQNDTGQEMVKANYSSTMELVRQITDLELAELVESTTGTVNWDQPDVKIELGAKEKSQTINLVTNEVVDFYYGKRTDPEEIYTVDSFAVESVIDKAKGVKEEEPETPTPDG